jgi:hypothetical protein
MIEEEIYQDETSSTPPRWAGWLPLISDRGQRRITFLNEVRGQRSEDTKGQADQMRELKR